MSQETEPEQNTWEQEALRLRAERDRYRLAVQDTLEQVDWCIGYFTAQKLHGLATRLSENRDHIRTGLLGRAKQPLPEPAAARP